MKLQGVKKNGPRLKKNYHGHIYRPKLMKISHKIPQVSFKHPLNFHQPHFKKFYCTAITIQHTNSGSGKTPRIGLWTKTGFKKLVGAFQI